MVIEIVTSVVILVAGITLFVLIHVCIIGRTFNTINNGPLMQRNGTILLMSRTRSMSQEDIKKLPSYDFNLEQQKSMELSTNTWLVKTGACPICRALVDIGREESSFSSEVGLELR
ncbi:hypothetical protein Tco_1424804 [Tanacetum coccineum]